MVLRYLKKVLRIIISDSVMIYYFLHLKVEVVAKETAVAQAVVVSVVTELVSSCFQLK